jgi:hypothetical protein
LEPTVDRAWFAPVVKDLLAGDRLMPLGPGTPNRGVYDRLHGLAADALFARPVNQPAFAQSCLAALWLLHDFLDESHAISQIDTVEGNYWHGILHRREPDYGNAKYWFRRVGRHAVFEPLRQEAARLAQSEPAGGAAWLAEQQSWDAFAFIDLCERAAQSGGDLETLCRRIQQREWELLFEYCGRQAV